MDEDYLLALQLQEQFNQENDDERDIDPYTRSSEYKTPITDPDWEKYDPNPDVHNLFRLFDAKFFWGTLGSVEVKWSRRMTMCAGICTYKGRGGCVISLSLPLLKFRPRKDLVETLLHEMIHAYLFITKNNKDRTGHGPEFQKHMSRINKSAGTNITIYHAFHDEVNYYKTHVWRCNGKCRANPPYFGIVRRAMNRAPGPNDFWFPEHQRLCGGSFGKISEPEGFKSRKGSTGKPEQPKQSAKPGNQPELTKFFTPNKLKSGSNPNQKSPNSITEISPSHGKQQTELTNYFFPKTGDTPSNQVHSLKNLTNPVGKTVKLGGNLNQVQGFTGLSNAKSSRTVVVNPKYAKVEKPNQQIHSGTTFVPFGGQGHTLGGGNIDRSKSRLLFPDNANFGSLQSPFETNPLETASCSHQCKKESDNSNMSDTPRAEVIDLSDEESIEDSAVSVEPHVNCPACSCPVPTSQINSHLDGCSTIDELFRATNDIPAENSDSEDEYSGMNTDDPIPMDDDVYQTVSCPKCNATCSESDINDHLDVCLSTED